MMSTYELKGQLLSIIARLEDERLLRDILEFINDLAKKVDNLEDMPAEAITELELAIQESYEDETVTPHEEVMHNTALWLAKQK